MNGLVGWTFTLTCCKHYFDSHRRTGHVSPQFHVVFDNDFTTVPYLRSSQVPPFWTDLVSASTKLHVYTKRQVDTWQSLPELTQKLVTSQVNGQRSQTLIWVLLQIKHLRPLSKVVRELSMSEHTSMLQVVSFQDQNASGNNNPQPNE